jgi:hypothetical protein
MSDTITTNAAAGIPAVPSPPLWRRPWAQAAAGLALIAAVAAMIAVSTPTHHPAAQVAPASRAWPQATDASQVVTGDGFTFAWAQERGGLAGPYPDLYGAGLIDNAATGFKPPATSGPYAGLDVSAGAELFIIARTPADAAELAGEMQSTVDAIDGANPAPSPFRLALVYLPNDPDRAAAGPLNVRVVGSEAALRYFLDTWAPNPQFLLPPPGTTG